MPPDRVAASGRRASSPSTDVSRHPHSARPQLLQPLAQAGSDGGCRVLHNPIPPALPVSSNVNRHGSSQSANLGPIWAQRPRLASWTLLAGGQLLHPRSNCGRPVVYAPVVYTGCGTSRSCVANVVYVSQGPARSTRSLTRGMELLCNASFTELRPKSGRTRRASAHEPDGIPCGSAVAHSCYVEEPDIYRQYQCRRQHSPTAALVDQGPGPAPARRRVSSLRCGPLRLRQRPTASQVRAP